MYDISSIISQCCGIMLYSSEFLLRLTIIDFLKEKLSETTNNLLFTTKKNGIHFGIIAQIDSNVYFVKVHHNYPIYRTYSNTVSGVNEYSTSESDIPSCPIKAHLDLDLKELFVYNVLARL